MNVIASCKLVSKNGREILNVMHEQWLEEFNGYMNKVFMATVHFPRTFVTEVYTTTQPILKEARRRGHSVGTAFSLETGCSTRRSPTFLPWPFLVVSGAR